jgi:dihydrofolate synthase/folylpolyglutamate synthase
VARDPLIIVDGAHNPHGAAAAAREMAGLSGPRVAVMAVSANKDIVGIVGPIAAMADVVVATEYGQPRSLAAGELAARARGMGVSRVEGVPRVADAIARARQLAGSEGSIVCAGSLFLVGQVREVVCGVSPDPVVLMDPIPRPA